MQECATAIKGLKTVKSLLLKAIKSLIGAEIEYGTTSDECAGITIIKIS